MMGSSSSGTAMGVVVRVNFSLDASRGVKAGTEPSRLVDSAIFWETAAAVRVDTCSMPGDVIAEGAISTGKLRAERGANGAVKQWIERNKRVGRGYVSL